MENAILTVMADLEINAARDRYARLCTAVESLVGSLKTSQSDDVLEDISEQLVRHIFKLVPR